MVTKFAKLLAAPLIAAGFAVVVASPASADQPAGCSVAIPAIEQNSVGQLVGSGSASCATSTLRTFGVLILADLDFLPDPVIAKGDSREAAFNYAKTVVTCDEGDTAFYYTQSSFVGFDYYESARQEITAC